MSAHKYKVGQTVPYCVTSRNRPCYGTAVILEQTYISGTVLGYMVDVGQDIDPDNPKLNRHQLYQSEIDKGHVKFKKRLLQE